MLDYLYNIFCTFICALKIVSDLKLIIYCNHKAINILQ